MSIEQILFAQAANDEHPTFMYRRLVHNMDI